MEGEPLSMQISNSTPRYLSCDQAPITTFTSAAFMWLQVRDMGGAIMKLAAWYSRQKIRLLFYFRFQTLLRIFNLAYILRISQNTCCTVDSASCDSSNDV